jgi:hypothetical protein
MERLRRGVPRTTARFNTGRASRHGLIPGGMRERAITRVRACRVVECPPPTAARLASAEQHNPRGRARNPRMAARRCWARRASRRPGCRRAAAGQSAGIPRTAPAANRALPSQRLRAPNRSQASRRQRSQNARPTAHAAAATDVAEACRQLSGGRWPGARVGAHFLRSRSSSQTRAVLKTGSRG